MSQSADRTHFDNRLKLTRSFRKMIKNLFIYCLSFFLHNVHWRVKKHTNCRIFLNDDMPGLPEDVELAGTIDSTEIIAVFFIWSCNLHKMFFQIVTFIHFSSIWTHKTKSVFLVVGPLRGGGGVNPLIQRIFFF